MDVRMKSSNHALLLLALFPVPRFTTSNKHLRGALEKRLIHECLDIVVEPLKIAASIGKMMADPRGQQKLCYTPLASCIVDTPESAMYACVAGKTSSVTMATYKQFGDPFRHEPRTASTTIAQLQSLEEIIDPCTDVLAYVKLAKKKCRLNGVHRPFWRNWPLAEPSVFLTPEVLHHLHKMFWDHDMKWCIRAVGAEEIDFRFTVLQPQTGYRHFADGVSKLKQVTGRVHRDLQRYLIAIIAGAVPKRFLIAIRALMDFRYLFQAPVMDETTCDKLSAALQEFHDHKDAIILEGVRLGKGKKVIEDWRIPKLEFMQSVVANIRANGVPMQWSADPTEHEHSVQIKAHGRGKNNQNYEDQICRSLDRSAKCDLFQLTTTIRVASYELSQETDPAITDDNDSDDNDSQDIEHPEPRAESERSTCNMNSAVFGPRRRIKNLFEEAQCLANGEDPQAPTPYRTFSTGSIAINLNRAAAFKRMSVEDAMALFQLPDLYPAFNFFLQRLDKGEVSMPLAGSRRNARGNCELPFKRLEVWTRMRVQLKSPHLPNHILSPTTLNAIPPLESDDWKMGRYDCAIANIDPHMPWPESGLSGTFQWSLFPLAAQISSAGHCVVQVRLIMHAVEHTESNALQRANAFLAYVERFDVVPQLTASGSRSAVRDPSTKMYLLKRRKRADGSRFGDIIFLSQLRTPVVLIPNFGEVADSRLSKFNGMEYASEFWLDEYFEKDFYLSRLPDE
jgi:hypothetical protein